MIWVANHCKSRCAHRTLHFPPSLKIMKLFKKSLSQLMSDGRWDKVRLYLNENQSFIINKKERINFIGRSLLARTLENAPPVDVVNLVINIDPGALSSLDFFGNTPLHIATGSCCEPATIKVLLERNSHAASVQDNDGRYPLHIAAATPQTQMGVLEMLFLAEPLAIEDEDSTGRTPLDIALEAGADEKFIDTLQRFTSLYKNALEKAKIKLETRARTGEVEIQKGRNPHVVIKDTNTKQSIARSAQLSATSSQRLLFHESFFLLWGSLPQKHCGCLPPTHYGYKGGKKTIKPMSKSSHMVPHLTTCPQ